MFSTKRGYDTTNQQSLMTAPEVTPRDMYLCNMSC